MYYYFLLVFSGFGVVWPVRFIYLCVILVMFICCIIFYFLLTINGQSSNAFELVTDIIISSAV